MVLDLSVKNLEGNSMALRKKSEEVDLIAPVGPGPVLLGAIFALQERNNWCWAACCDMALSQRQRPEVMQCQIALTYLQGECCLAGHCDSECDIVDVEKVFRRNNLPGATFISGLVAESDLRTQLTNGGGNTVALGLQGSPNHMVLVVGFAGSLFNVYDPGRGEGTWTLAEIMKGALENRTWTWTWINLR